MLFRWLRSTIPGLGQIGDCGARGEWEVGELAILRQVPDLAEDFGARGAALFFALDGLLEFAAEGVQRWVGIAPGVIERARIEQAHQLANLGKFEEERAFRNQQADGQLNRRDLRVQVEIDQRAEVGAIALHGGLGAEGDEGGSEREADGAGRSEDTRLNSS